MVVWMNFAAELAGRKSRKHLVHVHVGTCSGTRLENIHWEMIVVVARNNLGCGCLDCVSNFFVEVSQSSVSCRCRLLDPCQSDDVLFF